MRASSVKGRQESIGSLFTRKKKNGYSPARGVQLTKPKERF